ECWTGRCFIGDRPQECRPVQAWGEFYAEQRVRPFVRIAVDLGVLGGADLDVVERACDRVASGELTTPPRRRPACTATCGPAMCCGRRPGTGPGAVRRRPCSSTPLRTAATARPT